MTKGSTIVDTRRTDRTLLCCIFFVIWGLTTHGKYSATGDEPHYLMIAESLVTDGDLDLANNYAQDDGRLFGHDGLVNDGHALMNRTGTLESIHDIGLPVFLTVPYIVARHVSARVPEAALRRFRLNHGLFTYSMLSLLMVALTTIGCAFLLKTLAPMMPRRYAAITLAAVALSPPVLSYAFLIVPEVPAFLIVCVAVYLALGPRADANLSFGSLAVASLAFGLLPWFHRKFSVLVIGLLLLVVWHRRRLIWQLSWPRLALLAIAYLAPQALLYGWTWHEWGTFVGPKMMIHGLSLSLGTLPQGWIGLWFDREYGVLGYSPMYISLLAAIVLSWSEIWTLLVPLMLFFVPMAAFDQWWGGTGPAARYVVPIIPLCAIALGRASRFRYFRIAAGALLVCQVVVDAMCWQHPRWMWPQNTASNQVMDHLGILGHIYENVLPSVRHGITLWSLAACILLVLAINIPVLILEHQHHARPRPSSW